MKNLFKTLVVLTAITQFTNASDIRVNPIELSSTTTAAAISIDKPLLGISSTTIADCMTHNLDRTVGEYMGEFIKCAVEANAAITTAGANVTVVATGATSEFTSAFTRERKREKEVERKLKEELLIFAHGGEETAAVQVAIDSFIEEKPNFSKYDRRDIAQILADSI